MISEITIIVKDDNFTLADNRLKRILEKINEQTKEYPQVKIIIK